MTKKVFSILAIAAIAFTSCKKDDPNSNELGEATINGNIWAELDLTNSTPESVEGMQVTIIVDTENWDQDPDPSYNYKDEVYTTTVDASGDYSFTIPATELAYNVDIMYGDLFATRILADGETENVRVSKGDETVSLFAGATIVLDDEATVTSLGSNESDTYGSATIYGRVYGLLDVGFTPEGFENFTGGGIDVIWRYNAGDAPYSSSDDDAYQIAINNDGTYSFTFATEELGDNPVYLDWGVLDFEGSQVQLNAAGDGDTTVNGIWTTGWSWSGTGINYYNAEGPFEDGDLETNWDIEMDFNEF